MKIDCKGFQERTNAELNLSLYELEWLRDCVNRGVMSAEHAQGYIDLEERIVGGKRAVLGMV